MIVSLDGRVARVTYEAHVHTLPSYLLCDTLIINQYFLLNQSRHIRPLTHILGLPQSHAPLPLSTSQIIRNLCFCTSLLTEHTPLKSTGFNKREVGQCQRK
jgi:hypothetical protein